MKCEECGEDKFIPMTIYILKKKVYEEILLCPCEYYDINGEDYEPEK